MLILDSQEPTPSPMGATPAGAGAVEPGCVVACRLPMRVSGVRRPPVRPCLVLRVRDLGGRTVAILAPGLPPSLRAPRAGDVLASADELRGVSGVEGPLLFAAGRAVAVPLDDPALDPLGTERSPVLGHVDGAVLARVEAARPHPGGDRGRGGRPRGARARRTAAVRGVTFVVERRRPRPRLPRRPAPDSLPWRAAGSRRSVDRSSNARERPAATLRAVVTPGR